MGLAGGLRFGAVGLMALLAACSSASGNNTSSDSNAVDAAAAPITPTPTLAPAVAPVANTGTSITAVSYDTSIGNGVDTSGFADLPLRSGAKRFFVNSSTGSDGNGCSGAQSPSRPLATFDAAKACVTAGEGDQVLIAEGTKYSAGMSNMEGHGGYSPMYPTVIETYDPADPTNDSKYGRAAGNNRPVMNTGGTTNQLFILGTVAPQYIAVRGLDFNPGNIPDANIIMDATTTGTVDYILFENDIFRYTSISFDAYASPNHIRAQKFIMRNCSSYGQYSLTNGVGAQGVYIANVDGITFEDNVFWHNGWKVGASRSDAGVVGGPTIFNHPIYAQENTRNAVARRNVFLDTSSDGGNLKGGATYTQNLSIRNPQAAAAGGGTNYDTQAPDGVHIEIAYNAAIGGGQISTVPGVGGALDWGWSTSNGTSDSSVHHNVLARSSTQTGGPAFIMTADYNQPSYTAFHDNVSYLWSSTGATLFYGAYAAQILATVNSNVWDAPTSGTNINNSNQAFLNPYTESSLLAALGYSDESSFISDIINNPEKHVQRQGVLLMLNGYNVDTSAMNW